MNNLTSKLISTHRSVALLPLRLGAGTILAAHGAQKLFGWFGGYGLAGTGGFFESQLGMSPGVFWAFNAGAAEFFGGLMLLAGALTRVGAALNVGTMAVAVFMVQRNGFFADQGGLEFPLLLLAASATLLIAGGGGLSIDRALTRQAQLASAQLTGRAAAGPQVA